MAYHRPETMGTPVFEKTSAKPQVLLLYPKTGMDFGSTVAPPHALLTIAAPLERAGYNVVVLDHRVQDVNEAVLSNLISSDLICIGISCMTGTQVRNALSLARMARRLTDGKFPLVWGGTHPSVVPEQTAVNEFVDIVVVGEGDETFLELVKALENKQDISAVRGLVYDDGGNIVNTGSRPLLDVESLLPTPWHLINVESYIHRDMYIRERMRTLDLGQTSRGCPFDCGFCSSAEIRQRRWRAMSVEKSLDMILDGVRRFKLDGFWLRDDEFYIKRKRAAAIFEGMVEAGLDVSFYTSGTRADVLLKATKEELALKKRAGCHTLKIGAESGSPRILTLMQKGITVEQTLAANQVCKEHGIRPVFALMVGYPTETFEDINMTIDLAFRLKAENPLAQTETMAQYTALPGTPDFDLALKHGLKPPQTLEAWADWIFDDYDIEGRRSPWYTTKERIQLGNISYMSILSNAFENVVGTVGGKMFGSIVRAGASLVSKFYSWRLKRKQYVFAPELVIARKIRSHYFYGTSNDTDVTTEVSSERMPQRRLWTKYAG